MSSPRVQRPPSAPRPPALPVLRENQVSGGPGRLRRPPRPPRSAPTGGCRAPGGHRVAPTGHRVSQAFGQPPAKPNSRASPTSLGLGAPSPKSLVLGAPSPVSLGLGAPSPTSPWSPGAGSSPRTIYPGLEDFLPGCDGFLLLSAEVLSMDQAVLEQDLAMLTSPHSSGSWDTAALARAQARGTAATGGNLWIGE